MRSYFYVLYQQEWLEVDEVGMTEIAIANAIAKKAPIFAHVWQINLILNFCWVTVTNRVHYQDKNSDGEGEALWVDKVPETIVYQTFCPKRKVLIFKLREHLKNIKENLMNFFCRRDFAFACWQIYSKYWNTWNSSNSRKPWIKSNY